MLLYPQGQAGADDLGAKEGCQADSEHQRVSVGMRPALPAQPPLTGVPRVLSGALFSGLCLQFYPALPVHTRPPGTPSPQDTCRLECGRTRYPYPPPVRPHRPLFTVRCSGGKEGLVS